MASPTGYDPNAAPKALGGSTTRPGSSAPAWDDATDYDAGDEVSHNGVVWTAAQDPLVASEPTFDSADWNPAQFKGTQLGKTVDPTVTGGSDVPVTLGPDEGQPSSTILANEANRTDPLA